MFTSLGNSIPRNGLVGEWLLDGNANDTSGNGNNGTATNVTWVKTDKGYQSQSGSFNGSSGCIQVPDANILDLTNQYSILSLIKLNSLPTSGNLYAICDKVGGGNGWEFELWNDAGTYKLFITHYNAGSNTYLINYTPPINTYILIEATFSGTTINFYANGQLIGTVTGVTRTVGVSTSVLEIGRNPSLSSRYFNGQIQSTRIYNRAISEDERRIIYLESLRKLGPTNVAKYPKLFEGLTAYYDFRGDAQNIVDGTFNGTLVNSPTLTTDLFGNSKGYNFVRASAQHINGVKKLDDSLNNRTINFLINNDNNPGGNDLSLYTQWTSGLPYILMGINSANKFWFYNGISAILTTGTVSGINLITVTKSGTTYKIYINGVLDASGTISTASPGGVLNTQFANRPDVSGYSYQGKIYEVTMFNRVFSDDEASIMNSLIKSNYIYPSPSYDLPNLRDGLVLDLNEQGKDLSGNGNNATLTGYPVIVRQGKSKGLTYSGTGQYGLISTTSFINNQDLSVFARVKVITNPSGQSVILNVATDNQSLCKLYYITITGVQYIRLSTTDDGAYTASHTVNLSGTGWRRIGMTKSGTTQKIYLDGVFVGTSGNSGTNLQSLFNQGISIARNNYDATQLFNGNILNPRVWNRVLTDKEIQADYYSQKGNYIY